MTQFIYKDLTILAIIGWGAIIKLLQENKINFKYQLQIPVKIRNTIVCKRYLDFLIDDKVIVEVKVGNRSSGRDFNQIKEYLTISGYKLGLLVLFRDKDVKIYRIANIY